MGGQPNIQRRRWRTLGKLAGVGALAAVVVSTQFMVADAEVSESNGELIANGTFAKETVKPWWSYGSKAGIQKDALHIDVNKNGAELWSAAAGQGDIPLEKGKQYTFAFDVSASKNVEMLAQVQLGAEPYTPALAKGVQVGTKKQHFAFTFKSSLDSTQKGQVSFNVGGQGEGFSVVLDNVSLKEGQAKPAPKPTPKPTGDVTLPVEPPNSIAPGEPNPNPNPPKPDTPPSAPVPGEGPFAKTSGLYVDPESNPAAWAAENKDNPAAAQIESEIANKPIAKWFGGWSGDIKNATSAYVGAAGDKLPVLVAYNIPGRDCGSHSAGGAGSPEAYKQWIADFASGIGDKPALVIIEPDALAQLDCLDAEGKKVRTELLSYAVDQLVAKAPNAWTYMDGGNAKWIAPGEMAKRLQSVGVDKIRGFTVNVSNYYTTEESTKYADAVNEGLDKKSHYVIDTSRNGKGANGEWCNPGGRQIGQDPQAGGAGDALLWIKVPGDSDGACGIAPGAQAGQFDPKLATALIKG